MVFPGKNTRGGKALPLVSARRLRQPSDQKNTRQDREIMNDDTQGFVPRLRGKDAENGPATGKAGDRGMALYIYVGGAVPGRQGSLQA